MARYLDTTIDMCRGILIASHELTEGNKMMKNHLDTMCGNNTDPHSGHNSDVKIGGARPRSHDASPHRSVNAGDVSASTFRGTDADEDAFDSHG
jgi:hypothetical protein